MDELFVSKYKSCNSKILCAVMKSQVTSHHHAIMIEGNDRNLLDHFSSCHPFILHLCSILYFIFGFITVVVHHRCDHRPVIVKRYQIDIGRRIGILLQLL